MSNNLGAADVSVVIAVFNSSNTINRALESVLKQSLLPAELIVVDDASEDDSLCIIEQFSSDHSELNIKIIVHDFNMGAATARNTGWNMASCNYVSFLDSDDAWHFDKIMFQYNWMVQHPDYGLSGHACPEITNLNELVINSDSYNVAELDKKLFLFSNQFSTPTVMLKRNLPYRFHEGKRYAEDYLLWLEIVSDSVKIGYINLPLAGIFKSAYGDAGLSAELWNMELGELDVYKQLYKTKRLNFITLAILYTYSLLKYFRRLIIMFFR